MSSTESYYTQALRGKLKAEIPEAVIIKHSDRFSAGVPDTSVTYHGHTWWFEVKIVKNLGRWWKPVQHRFLARLNQQNDCRAKYIIIYCERWYLLEPNDVEPWTQNPLAYAYHISLESFVEHLKNLLF